MDKEDRTMPVPQPFTRDNCTGGTCPAATTLDDLPDDLVIRGKQASTAAIAALDELTSRGAGEHDVIISRALVRQALWPAAVPAGPAELQAELDGFGYTAWRIETGQYYSGATGPDFQWAAEVKARVRAGRTHQRVHVVTEPLTADMQEELTDGYGPSVAAGEDIRIISIPAGGDWPVGIPEYDFWLFDSCRLLVMNYTPGGIWTGAERIHDPELIVEACRVRDAAMHRATPWREFIASRPELKRRVAQ
jgi:hypothetical protein